MSRVIVCDTGPLLHLSEAGAIHLLKLAGNILIPPTVVNEFKRNLSAGELPGWIQVESLDAETQAQINSWSQEDLLDLGEAEAIGLALQRQSDWLLTDDAQARQFAERLGLEVHGSIGLLLWAVASGHVANREQAYRMLNGLQRSSLWISQRVMQEAAKAIDRLISQ